ncbi:hypothetical protein PGTUg99_027003 [Puccinia graminis f. sp. tritici]|uniref:Uncharacterized protein n=1 Tax=Puccinia graminis f. sp. tritici TaxID=56615 RepID=A0A5B0P2E2_PUCGR|nr:hypothetical protein PGTUg99_027003 [Puccinia graminis f. sp. tritici]
MLTALLANRAIGLFERRARVTSFYLAEKWVLAPYEKVPLFFGSTARSSKAATSVLPVCYQLGLAFFVNSQNWVVYNQLRSQVIITVHFKDDDGQDANINHTLANNSEHCLDIPHSKELKIDVISVGGMH